MIMFELSDEFCTIWTAASVTLFGVKVHAQCIRIHGMYAGAKFCLTLGVEAYGAQESHLHMMPLLGGN